MEADAQARLIFQLAALVDERNRAFRSRACGNRHLIAHLHVARHARVNLIFHFRAIARNRRALNLQADH